MKPLVERILDKKTILSQEIISPRTVNHAMDLHRLVFQDVEDEIFVDHQNPISKSLQPFFSWNDPELWIRRGLCDRLVKFVDQIKVGLRIPFSNLDKRYANLDICQEWISLLKLDKLA